MYANVVMQEWTAKKTSETVEDHYRQCCYGSNYNGFAFFIIYLGSSGEMAEGKLQ